MGWLKTVGVAAMVAAVVGCGRMADDEYAEATPDAPGLALEILGGADEGVDEAALVGEAAQKQGLGANDIEYLRNAREAVKFLNGSVRGVLQPIRALANGTSQPGPDANTRVFGPEDHGTATYRLTVRKLEPRRFGWKLEVKPIGAQDVDYEVVAAGRIARGDQPHRGRGTVGVDFDKLRAIDTAVIAEGKLFVGFGHGDRGKILSYALRGFTADASQFDPVNAAFVGHRLLPSKATRLRLAAHLNLADSPTAAKEFVRTRVRFIPGVGGRADLLATGGDVPQGKVYFGSACWDATETEGFAILRECVRGDPASCTVIATRGQRTNCKPDFANEAMPPEDEADASAEADAPVDEVVAPDGMPTF